MPRDVFHELVLLLAKPYAEESDRNRRKYPFKMICHSCRRRLRDEDGKKIVYKQKIQPPKYPFSIEMGTCTITNTLTVCPECKNPF